MQLRLRSQALLPGALATAAVMAAVAVAWSGAPGGTTSAPRASLQSEPDGAVRHVVSVDLGLAVAGTRACRALVGIPI